MHKLLYSFLISALATSALADQTYTLTIENHTFSPKELNVVAGQKFKLQVINKDSTPAEFESKPLGREKVIPAKSAATITFGPLKPGRYGFVEEYHEEEAGAQGTIIAQ